MYHLKEVPDLLWFETTFKDTPQEALDINSTYDSMRFKATQRKDYIGYLFNGIQQAGHMAYAGNKHGFKSRLLNMLKNTTTKTGRKRLLEALKSPTYTPREKIYL